MSLKKKVEATAKNIEGKAQEFFGEVTGNSQAQADGKIKQKEAKSEHIVENAKDRAKETVKKENK